MNIGILEMMVDEGRYEEGKMSPSYKQRWNNDGWHIVQLMNEAQDVYEFIYVETEV